MLEALRFIDDLRHAVRLVATSSWRRMITAWFYIPIGIFTVMAVCFGVHRLISLSRVSFPASVACMIILFFGLVFCETVLGDRKTRRVAAVIDVPCGFALRYINLFFCPAFVLLPLSPAINGTEVSKIIAVFVFGYAIMFTFTVYIVRGLQLVLGTSKRSITERAEELPPEDDNIPLAESTPPAPSETTEPSDLSMDNQHDGGTDTWPPAHMNHDANTIQAPNRAHDPSMVAGNVGRPVAVTEQDHVWTMTRPRQDLPSLSRPQVWATKLSANLDMLTYTAALLLVGLPVYYAADYAMPLQLCMTTVCFFLALKIPVAYRTYLHPVLVSSAFTIVIIWVFSLGHRQSLGDGLRAYSTGSKYVRIWDQGRDFPYPGAGDIFASILDVSIVALAIPMFQHRQELGSRFTTIVLPNVLLSVGSLLAYPALCHKIGISAQRSLAFASRSLTLALATPATQNLGGDTFTVAPLSIFSGIIGVAVGPWALRTLDVPEDDYITRGVALGANSAAIATARLLTVDPRAAAFSSLSMGLFGTITVALTSVPPLVTVVRGLAGL